MVYIYDILLNWSRGRIYEFYEWNNNDDIEHVKRIKLLKVSTNVLEDLFNYKIKIDISELNKLKGKDKSNCVKVLYTDSYRVLAIKYNSNGEVIGKSRLLLDEEEEILNISRQLDRLDFIYNKKKKYIDNFFTRKENYIRNYLINSFNYDYKNNNLSKLKYIYYEMYNIELDDIEEIYKSLIKGLSSICDYHIRIYDILSHNLYKKQA